MRAIPVLALLVACSDTASGPPKFEPDGGSYDLDACGYAVTTKLGAEKPFRAGSTTGSDPTPQFVHLGFIGDPRTTMVAQWRTVDETTTAGYVRYAAGDGLTADRLTETVQGVDFRYQGTGTQTYMQHQAHMCDLQPATTYSYQVGTDNHLSPIYTFHTAPDVGVQPDAESLIGVLGDSRDSAAVFGQLAGMLRTRAVDMMLFTGDAVQFSLVQDSWDTWLAAGGDALANTPIVMVDGNHEGNAINFYSQFAMPGDQENFGFDWGHAHFTIANDTPDTDPSALTTTTLDAIKADFQASVGARWKLLSHHQAMYTSCPCPRHPPDLTLRTSWAPVIDQYGIDLVLAGHAHQYEISFPLKANTVQSSNADGTVYVVSGGAGADLDPTSSGFWTQYAEQTYLAGVLAVRRDQMTLDSFRSDGSALTPGFAKTKP